MEDRGRNSREASQAELYQGRRSVGSRIDPASAMGGAGGGGGRAICALPLISPPPPQRSHRNDQRLTPMLEGGEGEEWEVRGSEEVTWTTAASQLIERPLGG